MNDPTTRRLSRAADPNDHLVEVPGTGHDLPRWVSPLIRGAI
jgi:hypothetical protein